MKNALKLAILASIILILAIGVTGCVTTSNDKPTTAPIATTQATVAPTKTPTKTPTATAPIVTDNNIVGLEAHWIGKGYTITTHFIKTTVDGRTAYKGTVTDSTSTYKVTDILTSTETEAASYADTLLTQYEARGFTVQSDNGNHQYVVLQGSYAVSIYGYSEIYGANSPGVGVLEVS